MKILFYCGIHNLVNFSRIRQYYDICYGFDANPDKVEQARKIYLNDPNVKIIYGALTEKGGEEVEFVITTDWTPASSLGQPNPDFAHMKTGLLKAQKKIKVPTINLYDFCMANSISEIDTLITDLQGIDLAVLKTMSELIKKGKIREIQCEVEPDHTPPRYLGIPTGKFSEFSLLLSDQYDVLWVDPANPKQSEGAWEMDVRWRVKGGQPPDGIEFVIENELLEAKIHPAFSLSTYSQYREDLVIDALFKHKSDGFYVDIGANDPIVFSNTNLFYNRGWHGINVEPDPNLHAKLCTQRVRDININAGVGPEPGIMTFYRMSADTLSSFNKQAAIQAGKLYGATLVSEEQTRVLTLKDILESNLKGRNIDFMSVDAEGYDLAVLESNVWSLYRPSVIIVEINVGGNDIVEFLQRQDYILIFDNGTNGIFIAEEFCDTLDDSIRKELCRLENSHGLRTVLPLTEDRDKLTVNIVYGHQHPGSLQMYKRGNISTIWSHLPIEGCDHYVYHNAFSYRGRLPGLNILLMLEPAVVLPGEFDEDLWKHFDHILGMFDIFDGFGSKFHKIYFPCINDLEKAPSSDQQNLREHIYSLEGRKNAICMISGNKSSHVPGELYSKRIEIAQWFNKNSPIPFDVFGKPPFQLPNYRGVIPDGQKFEVLKQYRYSLCFENTSHPILSAGYVTEKIIDCLLTRTVPIYLGASNIEEYIPAECFIDYRKFAGPGELEQYLQTMSDKEYKRYISAIDRWVTRDNLQKYSTQAFCDALAMICAEAPSKSPEMLFNGERSWTKVKAVPPTARSWQFVSHPEMWTWKHLAKAEPPIVENGKLRGGKHIAAPRKSGNAETPPTRSFMIGKKPSIKVLAAGTKFLSGNARCGYDYGWWNLFDTLNRFENIETLFFDYATEAQQRGIAGMSERLEEIVFKEKPDILFYYPSNDIVGILHSSLEYITLSADTQTVIWIHTYNEFQAKEALIPASCANYIVTVSPETAGQYTAAGYGTKIIESQWGFNPHTYFTSSYKHRDISFYGTSKGNRPEILERIKESGLSVDVFGSGWHENSFIPFYDMVRIIGQSGINLNLSDTTDFTTHRIQRRTFEVPGCRGFLLTIPSDHLEEYYEPGKEVIVASSREELVDKSRYYLAHEPEREIIAQRGYERTLADHTWSHRLIDIFKQIGFTAIPQQIPVGSRLSNYVPSSSSSIPASKKEHVSGKDLEGSYEHDKEDIETSIVVISYNKLEYTKQCIESILHYTEGNYELLLADNGSTDGTFEYYDWVKRVHPNTRVIKNFQNRNVEALGNYVFSQTHGKYIAGVANDAVVHEGWLERFKKHIESAPDIAIVGSRSNSISGPQIAQVDYNTLEAYHTFAAEWSKQHEGSNFVIQRLVGIAALLRKAVIERIGNVDPDLPVNGRDGGYGFSDDDLSLRMLLAGYRALVANDVLIHHHGSVTTRQYRPDLFGAPQNINKEKFIKKLKQNDRVTIEPNGELTLKPYSLDDDIPVAENTVIRSPRICIVESNAGVADATGLPISYSALAGSYHGEFVSLGSNSIQSLLTRTITDREYDFIVLIDKHLSPSPPKVQALIDTALCYPDVALMVPVGNYAPSTHVQKTSSAQEVEIIPYADLSLCVINLNILRPLIQGLTNCENDDELLWFMQRRVRGESYFIAKINTIEVNGSVPMSAHPYDAKTLPERLIKERKYTEAISSYKNDLHKDPNFTEAHYQLACIAREQRQAEEAIKQAQQALATDPHHIASLILLSSIFIDQNDLKRAGSFVKQANFKQPGNPDVQKIVAQYEKVLKEKPGLLQAADSRRKTDLTNVEFAGEKTSIIVVASSKQTSDCLFAIKKHTKEPYDLIVLDNLTSHDLKMELGKSVKEHSRYEILEHHKNEPLLKSVNRCINRSTGEYIVLLTDDTIVTAGWLSRMLECMNSADNIGLVGPVSNLASGLQLIENVPYNKDLDHMEEFALAITNDNFKKAKDVIQLDDFCLLIKFSALDLIGGFDEGYNSGGFAYDDLCLRSHIAGYRNVIAQNVFVHRYGKMTPKDNCRYFAEKWRNLVEVSENGYTVHITKEQQLKKLLEWGEEQFTRGDVEAAVKIFERILLFDKTNAEALNNLGVIQWQLGDVEASMDTFQTILNCNPKNLDAFTNLAAAIKDSSRYDLLDHTLMERLKPFFGTTDEYSDLACQMQNLL